MKFESPEDDLLGTTAAGRHVGRTPTMLRRYHAGGVLPGVVIAGRLLFRRGDLDALRARLDERERASAALRTSRTSA